MLKLASSFFVVAALVIGAIAVTRMDDIRKNQAGSYQMNTEENEADRIYTNADSTAVVQGGNRDRIGWICGEGGSCWNGIRRWISSSGSGRRKCGCRWKRSWHTVCVSRDG